MFFLWTKREAIVRGPTRPTYIVPMTINLLKGLKSGVIPVDSPTVPNADTVSKKISIKLIVGLSIVISNVLSEINDIATINNTYDFDTASCGIFLLKALHCLFVIVL